jgi:hypothetical protein
MAEPPDSGDPVLPAGESARRNTPLGVWIMLLLAVLVVAVISVLALIF